MQLPISIDHSLPTPRASGCKNTTKQGQQGAMDHILRLHVVEHHTARARVEKGVDASSRAAVLALAAVASVAAFLAAAGSQVATTKAALFVLSNAIILALLLAADCRCFFFAPATSGAVVVDACEEEPAGHVLGNKNRCAVSEALTEPAMASDGTTALDHALEDEQEDVPPRVSRPEELLGMPDEGESGALELETVPVVEEPTCKTAVPVGLDELGIDELNKKFDDFIQSRRSKWIKEEAYLLAVSKLM